MSGARPDTWMKMYWGDYLKDTGRLTTEGHGAYLLLIADYWTSGAPLPDDDKQLAAITRLPIARWRALRSIMARFFQPIDGVWRHKRIEEEIECAKGKMQQTTDAGHASAAAKAERKRQQSGNGMPTDVATEAQQNANPSASASDEAKEETDATASAKTKGESDGKSGRGTRLPADWEPDSEDREFARELGLSPDLVWPGFRDYWLAQPGARGRKSDWPATWRNWCRREAETHGGSGGRGPGSNGSRSGSVVAAFGSLLADREAS